MKELVRPPLKINTITNDPKLMEIYGAVKGLQLWAEQISRVINNLVSNIPSDSTAVDVAGIVSDFNDLLAVLRGLSVR